MLAVVGQVDADPLIGRALLAPGTGESPRQVRLAHAVQDLHQRRAHGVQRSAHTASHGWSRRASQWAWFQASMSSTCPTRGGWPAAMADGYIGARSPSTPILSQSVTWANTSLEPDT